MEVETHHVQVRGRLSLLPLMWIFVLGLNFYVVGLSRNQFFRLVSLYLKLEKNMHQPNPT